MLMSVLLLSVVCLAGLEHANTVLLKTVFEVLSRADHLGFSGVFLFLLCYRASGLLYMLMKTKPVCCKKSTSL